MGKGHECTKVHKPYKKTASNRHAAPSDSKAAVPVSQEKDTRMQHNYPLKFLKRNQKYGVFP